MCVFFRDGGNVLNGYMENPKSGRGFFRDWLNVHVSWDMCKSSLFYMMYWVKKKKILNAFEGASCCCFLLFL